MPPARYHTYLMAKILGIVNVTRDSFSDGGRFLDPAAAIDHAVRLLADGADMIDIGAESTHPDAESVPADVEIARLTPVIESLKNADATVSVDTCKPAVIRHVLALGVDFINDVTALESPGAIEAVRDSNARLILMHAIRQTESGSSAADGRAVRPQIGAQRIMDTILSFFRRRIAELQDAGIARERLILDPGMGFFLSKDPGPSLAVLRGLRELSALGCALLVCTSRKSFIGALLGESAAPRPVTERSAGTLATELWAAAQGVAYIRTHDVRALRDGLRMWTAIQAAAADFPPG